MNTSEVQLNDTTGLIVENKEEEYKIEKDPQKALEMLEQAKQKNQNV